MNNNYFNLSIRTVANGWSVSLVIGAYGTPGYRNEDYSFNNREEMLAFMHEQLVNAPQSNLGVPDEQW